MTAQKLIASRFLLMWQKEILKIAFTRSNRLNPKRLTKEILKVAFSKGNFILRRFPIKSLLKVRDRTRHSKTLQ